MKFIVDASVIFSGLILSGGNDYITTEATLLEIRSSRFKRYTDSVLVMIQVMEPQETFLEKVRKLAKDTGDLSVLSDNDIELIALAIQESGILLTNDLAMQNVARELGIKYESFNSKKIKDMIKWKYRCIGCHRTYDKMLPSCPYCGNELRKVPISRKKVQ